MTGKMVKLDRFGRKELVGHIAGPIFIATLFFLASGRADLYRAWLWALVTLIYYLGGLMVILKVNPGLLNERGKWNKRKDTKKWDKVLLQVFGTVGLYFHTILMALDVGRFEWSQMDPCAVLLPSLPHWSFSVYVPGLRTTHCWLNWRVTGITVQGSGTGWSRLSGNSAFHSAQNE